MKELIAAHGGRVEVDSTPGFGSTFRVWLPLDLSEEQRDDHRAFARA